MSQKFSVSSLVVSLLFAVGCSDDAPPSPTPDAGSDAATDGATPGVDAGSDAGGALDSGALDASDADAGAADAALDAGGTGDAGGDPCMSLGGASCFVLPSAALVGHEISSSQGPDNFCTRVPSDSPTGIQLQGTSLDGLSLTGAGPTTLSVFYASGFSGTPDVTGTSDGSGVYSVDLPAPVPNEFDVKLVRTGAYDTHFIDAHIFFSSTVGGRTFPTVLRTTWSALAAVVGETADPSKGQILGTTTDCDDRTLEFAVVVISSTSSVGDAAPTFVPGTRVYYLDGAPLVPALHSVRSETGATGGFTVFGLQNGASVYLQVWGFEGDAAVAMGMAGLTLVGERQVSVVADVLTATVITPRSGP